MGPAINLFSQPGLVLILQLSEEVREVLKRDVLGDLVCQPPCAKSQPSPPLWQEGKACLSEALLGHLRGWT